MRMIERVLGNFGTTGGVAVLLSGCLAVAAGLDYATGQLADATYGAGKAKEFVEQSGYKDVSLKGVDHLFVGLRGCADSDEVEYEFSVTTSTGQQAEIDICKGILKGATLRHG